MENGTGDVNDVMPRSDGLMILAVFLKKELVKIWSWTKRVDFWAWQGQSSWVYEMRRAWWGQMEQSA